MDITVNGDRAELESDCLAEALRELGFTLSRVVVAVNDRFVPKSDWPTAKVCPQDRIEVLSVIEGG